MKRWLDLTADQIAAKSAANRKARKEYSRGGDRRSLVKSPLLPNAVAKPPKRAKPKLRESKGETLLALQLRAQRLYGWQCEYIFAPPRKWRADFAFPEKRLLIEVEGGIWTRGRHTRGGGFENDCEKYNAATIGGWRVLRFSTDMVKRGNALGIIIAALIDTARNS
jgi:very-short-patch-repair endonuclease